MRPSEGSGTGPRERKVNNHVHFIPRSEAARYIVLRIEASSHVLFLLFLRNERRFGSSSSSNNISNSIRIITMIMTIILTTITIIDKNNNRLHKERTLLYNCSHLTPPA